jgi:hypothetical protein
MLGIKPQRFSKPLRFLLSDFLESKASALGDEKTRTSTIMFNLFTDVTQGASKF